MPSRNDLVRQIDSLLNDRLRSNFILERQNECLRRIGELRGGRQVILYGSAFLQQPDAPAEHLQVTQEDMNGLMEVAHTVEGRRGLSLILHVSGGRPEAADAIVSYLRSRFESIEVIIPALALSAGAMIGLGSDRLVMGGQSQLGPIDPQLSLGRGRTVSARAVVEQFERVRNDVLKDASNARAWAPVMRSMTPSLVQEAHRALHYSEVMVIRWLKQYMFADRDDPEGMAKSVAQHFNDASRHRNLGRIIDRDEARAHGLVVEDLESNEELREAVLTSYRLMTISFERSLATRTWWSDVGLTWMKGHGPTGVPPQGP